MTPKEQRDKEMARVAKKAGLTTDQLTLISLMMNEVWNEVGSDLLQCAGIGERSGKSIPRDEVIEVVTDAGRLDYAVRNFSEGPKRAEAAEVLKLYYAMDPAQQRAVDRYAFPAGRYGW